ncbi:protein tiptop isoform X2 [Zeugodacus cucurbitae]|uniref:protein tiptop isoform X2 n=1 Tax=Zeugodacus cucurbitae TaxID=28588 RepID=UPI000596A1B9|nr:protein tiptop isoform X2 [Zeugodacus cucurbitae]
MMLHEAVMLEIYRQALTASELTSPRCQSRESNVSAAAMEGRCPSNGSHCSGNERSTTPATSSLPSTPPAGLPLQATLAPAAAAALLPPQSAAMAAYFNAAAAAAAQQNHLLLTNPLAAAASLVQQATQAHSPTTNRQPATPTSPQTDVTMDEPVLDFSTKRRRMSERESDDEDDNEERNEHDGGANNVDAVMDANSPLDLTVGGRKRASTVEEPPHLTMRKTLRTALPTAASNWVPTINPYLAAVAAASLSPPKSPLSPLEWSGKHKLLPNEATKALEKMTEMTRLGSATDSAELPPHRQLSANGNNNNANSGGRHSAWQSHWLNKGADAVRDVFKCVWCKQSFPTLATLTVHMKETQHCGVNMPATATANTGLSTNGSGGNQTAQSTHHLRHSANAGQMSATSASAATTTHTTTAAAANKSDLNLLIKETMPLPRKLVRGQDVWLGKGAEQTREILKCMWCGQSFRSLAEMTSHMQETQHYTNIISQEQIISWKSTDDKNSNSSSSTSNGGGATTTTSTSPVVTTPPTSANTAAAAMLASPNNHQHNNNNTAATVSAVLTCKVCDQAFATLKELSNHMMKNSHYKEHMMRAMGGVEHAAMTPTTTAATTNAGRRGGRQLREKRKKSLPVRKLLELERAQQDYKLNSLDPALKPLRDFAATTKITCEKCGEKIETALFVDHIRQCLGGMLLVPARNHNNSSDSLKSTFNAIEQLASPQTPSGRSDGRKTADSNMSHASATRPEILYPLPKDGEKASTSSTPSVLNAIEQLIEKSFDTRPRNSGGNYASSGNGSQRSTPLGSSILKRLGIDDSVDYTKPLLDPQTMHFMRSYSNYSARDRSASESSSISERCSSRIESFTPERSGAERASQATPRLTPDKLVATKEQKAVAAAGEDEAASVMNTELLNIKSEPTESTEPNNESQELPASEQKDAMNLSPQKISVKKEFNMIDNHEDERQSSDALHYKPQARTPCSRATSPSASERSITPKSMASPADKRFTAVGSSLTALSSMFDSLNNMSSGAVNAQSHTNADSFTSAETNNNNNNNTNKKSNANPLAALQKLCETTEKPTMKTRSATSNGISHNSQLSGNMMAFSWACNDAVQNTNAESMIKCTQCDAVFSSKGAYRHHFSKVHYSKEDCGELNTLASTIKSPSSLACSPKSAAVSPKSASKSPVGAGSMSAPIINPYSESSQSKFLKYTELAKQLSSKNA